MSGAGQNQGMNKTLLIAISTIDCYLPKGATSVRRPSRVFNPLTSEYWGLISAVLLVLSLSACEGPVLVQGRTHRRH